MSEKFSNGSKKTTPFRLNRAEPLFFVGTLGIMGMTAYLAFHSCFLVPNTALAVAYTAASLGSMARNLLYLDSWAMTRFVEGRSGRFSRAIATRFWNSPIRFFTVNKLAKRLDDKKLSAELAVLQKQKKIQKTKSTDLELKDNRTASYLLSVSDPRKHLRSITVLGLSVFTGIRTMAQLSETFNTMTSSQVGLRVGGYLFGVVVAGAHLDAWVQRRVAEEHVSPFFGLSNRILVRTPLRRLGRQLIRWDYHRAQNVITGRQSLRWQKRHSLYSHLPESALQRHLMDRLEKKKMIITPAVQMTMAENKTAIRLAAMEKILTGDADKRAKEEKIPSWKEWTMATKELFGRNREIAKETVDLFQAYSEKARKEQVDLAQAKKEIQEAKKASRSKSGNPIFVIVRKIKHPSREI